MQILREGNRNVVEGQQQAEFFPGKEVFAYIQKRKRYLDKLISEKRMRIQTAPEGILRVNHRPNKKTQYYLRRNRKDHNGVYIPESRKELVCQLAQKAYDEKVIQYASEESRELEKLINIYQEKNPDEVYDSLPLYRREIVVPAEKTREMFIKEWEGIEYERKGFAPGTPEFLTNRGERVRSKSELIIANILSQEGIPYRYEYPLTLKGVGTVYPDFMVLNVRTRRELAWEHQGMMDDPDYAVKAVKKMQSYILNGVIPGIDLIVTSETRQTPLNVRIIKDFIKAYCI